MSRRREREAEAAQRAAFKQSSNRSFGGAGIVTIANLLNPHPVSLSTLLNPHPITGSVKVEDKTTASQKMSVDDGGRVKAEIWGSAQGDPVHQAAIVDGGGQLRVRDVNVASEYSIYSRDGYIERIEYTYDGATPPKLIQEDYYHAGVIYFSVVWEYNPDGTLARKYLGGGP